MSWRLLLEFTVSIAYGVLSSLIPIFNSEIYIVASQVGGFAEEATTAIGCAIGQGIGKAGLVLALRRGVNFRLAAANTRSPPEAGWEVSDEGARLVGSYAGAPRRLPLGSGDRLSFRFRVRSAAVPGDVRRGRNADVGRHHSASLSSSDGSLLFLAIAFGISALAH